MSGDGTGSDSGQTQTSGEISPEDREAIRRRSSEIGQKLDAVKARKAPAGDDEARRRGSAMGMAFRFAAELVVGVAVGGFIGWVLDRHFGTAPWLLLIFGAFGFAAGLLNLFRAAKKAQAENEPLQRAAQSVPDDDDET